MSKAIALPGALRAGGRDALTCEAAGGALAFQLAPWCELGGVTPLSDLAPPGRGRRRAVEI